MIKSCQFGDTAISTEYCNVYNKISKHYARTKENKQKPSIKQNKTKQIK